MIKGVSKRVIVVKTPDESLFAEAIFILNENALRDTSCDSESVLREACAVADDFVLRNCGSEKKRFGSLLRPIVMSNLILITAMMLLYLLFLH